MRAGVVDSYLIPAHQSKAVLVPEWSAVRPLVLEVPRYFSDELTGAVVAVGMPGRKYQLVFEGPENFVKTMELHLNRWGQAKQTVIPSEFPVGSTTLVRILAMDEQGQPQRVLKTLKSSLPMEEPLVMTRWVGSLRSLGLQIPELLLNGFLGPNKEFQSTDGEGPIGGTHGVVEIPENFQ